MRLIPNTPIFGVKPEILRDCADQLRDMDSFSVDDFCEAIGAPAEEAMPVLEHLLREDFVRPDNAGQFIRTIKFIQLANAKITDGLSRAEAEILLGRVIERARDINARPAEFDHHITRLAVFGSYLGNKELLGDLDIAFDYQSNPMLSGKQVEPWCYGKSVGSFSQMLSHLRLRKPRQISLHTLDEIKRLKTPYKIVFEHKPQESQE